MSAAADSPREPTPWTLYRSDLERNGFQHDPAQEAAVRALDALCRELRRPRSGWRRLLPGIRAREPVRGLYLWGSVGRGKTYLMDLFHASLPSHRAIRVHFHRFMRELHERLRDLRELQDPLATVAGDIARETRVLCFDEFFVSDITDAMLLGTLLEHLFAGGVTLVATSNVHPDGLYRGGLQRQRFLPAIERLKRHLRVLHLDGNTDYRLRALDRARIYHWPDDARAEAGLAESFRRLAGEPADAADRDSLTIEGRRVAVRRQRDGVLWVDFDTLCRGPRSQNDYLEIARCYHSVLLSGIPVLDRRDEDAARRFVNLVDVFYDRSVNLIVSAAAAPAELYRGRRLAFEFRRTVSRLEEMQSHDYLARPHRP
ncbi:MAG TPA: cell division protein ZapE [Gammaproteobacteria bacterium]|nr:cell division protein ZapE [Gammaproteobacteria bacterium]